MGSCQVMRRQAKRTHARTLVGALLAIGSGGAALAATTPASAPGAAAPAKAAAPSARGSAHLPGYNPDRNAYFGDLHVHTGLSFDAYIFNVRATPDDAYAFAKGSTIGHASGFNIRRAGGPLDFTAVTDHSEYMGSMREANDPSRPLSKSPLVQGLFSPDPKAIRAAFDKVVALSHANKMPKE